MVLFLWFVFYFLLMNPEIVKTQNILAARCYLSRARKLRKIMISQGIQ